MKSFENHYKVKFHLIFEDSIVEKPWTKVSMINIIQASMSDYIKKQLQSMKTPKSVPLASKYPADSFSEAVTTE